MKKCPYCYTELRDDDVFCYACGEAYKPPAICRYCGTKLVERAQFCLYCGEPVYGGRNIYKEYPNEFVKDETDGEGL